MTQKKEKIALSKYREIAVLAAVIPLCRKAMGYRADSAINRLGAEVQAQIAYHIGDELKELELKIKTRVDQLMQPFQKEAEGIQDKEVLKEINSRFAQELKTDSEFTALSEDLERLWEKEVEKDIQPVEIELLDYSTRFPEDDKEVTLYGHKYTLNGYDALLALDAMGLITYKEPA